MREVQQHAMGLFEDRGYDGVTVEQVADASGVSPISVYRWFGTKEQLVLWDDYDPDLFAAIAERLSRQAPLPAVRDAVVAELGAVYDTGRALILARTKLIYREPSLLGAALRDARMMSIALADLFADAERGEDEFARRVLAEVAVATLTSAIDAWQRADGEVDLAEHVESAFGVLRGSSWTS